MGDTKHNHHDHTRLPDWHHPANSPGHNHHGRHRPLITPRDYFAAKYLAAVVPGKKMTETELEDFAREAYRVADVFLRISTEKEKGNEEK